jgi:DNA-binding response OmpR family regulator
MTTSALIVEDDPKIMDVIEDTLCSFGHDHTWVTNQFDARAALRTQDFRYVLLDLQIPAKPNRGGASKEFGVNLLREIRDQRDSDQLPVVIMTAYSSDCLDLTTELIADGASDFISKPFHDKRRTLAKVIREVLRSSRGRRTSKSSQKSVEVQPFPGGEMVFHPTRVELCGVKICGDTKAGRIRRILDELSQRTSRGNFVAYSGDELAAQVGCRVRGQNAISETIRDFRKYVTAVMLAEANLQVGPRDVIQSGGRGYRFADKIVVGALDDPQSEPVHKPIHFDGDPVTTGLNDRQQWIISELRAGNALKICDVMKQFQCSNTTAKRDLTDLRRRELIAFAGPPRTGVWKLCRES